MKRAQFNFVWLFAILAGVAILILAIYGVTKLSQTSEYEVNTILAQQFNNLIDPLATGFSETSTGYIDLNREVKIENYCTNESFGTNRITIFTRSSTDEKWTTTGLDAIAKNKYIFSSLEPSRTLNITSIGFNLPFKITDLTLITTKNYCLQNAPEEIKSLVSAGAIKNFKVEPCEEDDITVCFDRVGCDIHVRGDCIGAHCETGYETGIVTKEDSHLSFVGSLLFAAIIADKDTYECNVQRIIYRASTLYQTIHKKAELMESRNCNPNIISQVEFFQFQINNVVPRTIPTLYETAKNLDDLNSRESCALW
jgi:hypothetical protein